MFVIELQMACLVLENIRFVSWKLMMGGRGEDDYNILNRFYVIDIAILLLLR